MFEKKYNSIEISEWCLQRVWAGRYLRRTAPRLRADAKQWLDVGPVFIKKWVERKKSIFPPKFAVDVLALNFLGLWTTFRDNIPPLRLLNCITVFKLFNFENFKSRNINQFQRQNVCPKAWSFYKQLHRRPTAASDGGVGGGAGNCPGPKWKARAWRRGDAKKNLGSIMGQDGP